MHTGKENIKWIVHSKKALEAFEKMATSTTVGRENVTNWRGFRRGVRQSLKSQLQNRQ